MALVLVDYAGEGKVAVMPLFVAITDDMDIQFCGELGGSAGGGGGPRRGFKAAKEQTVLKPDVA